MENKIFNVLDKLNSNGYQAYIVGGYVRDYFLGKHSFDIDICSNAKPREIMNIFKEFHPVSFEYGNVVLNIDRYKFEITTFRKDINYINNRRPEKVVYVNSLEEDIIRRDFTINSICMDKENNIIDYFNGKNDIKKKIISSIGDPFNKMKEDSLRILRAIRFATILNFKIDDNLKKAIETNKYFLKELSYERKKEELNKIFSNKNKKYGVKLLKELDLLEVLELKNIDNVLLTKDLMGIWATITDANYSFTKSERVLMDDINSLLKKDLNNKETLYKYGQYILSIVCDLKKLNKKYMIFKYELLPIKGREEIKITSIEICQIIDKEPGCYLKDIYIDLEKQILNKRLKNDNKKIKEYIYKNYSVI